MIDYLLLHNSIEYYKDKGYQRIEVPWMVSEYVDNITKPKGIPSFQIVHNSKCLVASGEQSFLELYMKRYLPFGTFITVTPCYRFEVRDDMHCKTFMKAELIKTDEVNETALMEMIHTALEFYKQYLPDAKVVKTDIGYDIEVKIGDESYELGSYGIRKCDFLEWIYGTACAEPRLSRLIKKYGEK